MGHKKALLLFCLMSVGNLYSYGLIFSSLTLYLTALGASQETSVLLFSTFLSMTYGFGIIGGYLGDKISRYYCGCIGSLSAVIGLTLFLTNSPVVINLSLFAIGIGLFTPNYMAVLGQVYDQQHPMRFGIFLINNARQCI